MVHVTRSPENSFVAVVATDISGEGRILQYTFDSPYSRLPGQDRSPKVLAIYDLTGGFNITNDRARSVVQSLVRGNDDTTATVLTRLQETPEELLKAFADAGFPPPRVKVPLTTHITRWLTRSMKPDAV